MQTVNTMVRVRMLRNVARRPDLSEGAVCDLPAEDAGRLLAAHLAEAVADAGPAQGANLAPCDSPEPPVKRARKPRPAPAA